MLRYVETGKRSLRQNRDVTGEKPVSYWSSIFQHGVALVNEPQDRLWPSAFSVPQLDLINNPSRGQNLGERLTR